MRRIILLALAFGLGVEAAPPSVFEVSRAVKETGLDPAQCYRVRDLRFTRDDIKLFFNDGYLIFSKPVLGRRLAAVFTSEVEGGDGEIIIIPPTREERESIANYIQSPNLDEHMRAAVIILTSGLEDALLKEVQDRAQANEGAKLAPEIGAVLAGQWDPALLGLATPMQMRLVRDLLTPRDLVSDLAFFVVDGKALGSFDVISDGRANRRIEVRQPVDRDANLSVNTWTSFLPRVERNRAGATARPPKYFQLQRYSIDAEIGNDLAVKATTRVSVRIGAQPVRAFPFELATAMQVSAVRVDGKPAEILRDRSFRSRIGFNGVEDEFLVVPPDDLAAGSEHEFEFEHRGNVIATRGEGVYFVNSRGSWYPHVVGEFAPYDLTFRYPKRLTLVAAGDSVEERTDGDWRITHRKTDVPISAAGFNLGSYEKISGAAAGVRYEVYGNKNIENALRPQFSEPVIIPTPQQRGPGGRFGRGPIPQVPMSTPPDPLGRLRAVASDLSSALEFFTTAFGPPALKTLTVAPIPGTFGQGFPGLVYLSTFAYLDARERPAALRNAREQVFFSDLLVPHEAAHQWWGIVVTTNRREDQWLMEALANYSALLWLEKKKGFKTVETVLDGYRNELLSKDTHGAIRESAGPVVWGDRLESSLADNSWRVITYNKGTWILHMLRRRIGDEAFMRLLKTITERYQFKSLTTADLQSLARELRPRNIGPEVIDAFFDSWVYRTGVPTLKIRSSFQGTAPNVKLTGTLEQSGVGDDFSAEIPIEIQAGAGPPQIVWVRTSGESKAFSATLRQPPTRVVISNDVLMKR